MGYCPVRDPKSSATFCCTAVSSSCEMLTSMPVRSLKGCKLAAIAEVGAVFSEIKESVKPENCFHMPPPAEACDLPEPQPHPPIPRSEAPTSPVPAALRKFRRLRLFGAFAPPSERPLIPSATTILLLWCVPQGNTRANHRLPLPAHALYLVVVKPRTVAAGAPCRRLSAWRFSFNPPALCSVLRRWDVTVVDACIRGTSLGPTKRRDGARPCGCLGALC